MLTHYIAPFPIGTIKNVPRISSNLLLEYDGVSDSIILHWWIGYATTLRVNIAFIASKWKTIWISLNDSPFSLLYHPLATLLCPITYLLLDVCTYIWMLIYDMFSTPPPPPPLNPFPLTPLTWNRCKSPVLITIARLFNEFENLLNYMTRAGLFPIQRICIFFCFHRSYIV